MIRSQRRLVVGLGAFFALAAVLGIGVRLGRGDFAVQAWLTTILFLALMGAIVWHFLLALSESDNFKRALHAARRGSVIAVLAIVLLVANCSSNLVTNASGMGYVAILADPGTYLATAALLVGPLLIVLALPALLTIGLRPVDQGRLLVVVVVSALGVLAAAATFMAAMITSFSGLLCGHEPSVTCIASSGAVAGFFGWIGPLMVLPFALSVLTRRPSPAGPLG